MNRVLLLGVLAFCLIAGSAACEALREGGKTKGACLSVAVLKTGRFCMAAAENWNAVWISSPEALRAKILECNQHRVEGEGALPEVDFSRDGVLVVEMGQRPSGGYGFDARDASAEATGQTAIVRLTVHQPAAGTVTTQEITSPFIMVRMPRGEWRSIRVIDQGGHVLTETKLP